MPIIIGSNKHEGQLFVYGAFPKRMPKPVYWLFVGALFRESSGKVLRHYRSEVKLLEDRARAEGSKLGEEERARQRNEDEEIRRKKLHEELKNFTRSTTDTDNDLEILESLRGGYSLETLKSLFPTLRRLNLLPNFLTNLTSPADPYLVAERARIKLEKRILKRRGKLVKKAEMVFVDYRPVMSMILDDYLFRCPSWR